MKKNYLSPSVEEQKFLLTKGYALTNGTGSLPPYTPGSGGLVWDDDNYYSE